MVVNFLIPKRFAYPGERDWIPTELFDLALVLASWGFNYMHCIYYKNSLRQNYDISLFFFFGYTQVVKHS